MKKKIGILTFHRSVNNGAVMQCYSLAVRLQKDFPDYDVEVIDCRQQVVEDMYSYSFKSYLFSAKNPKIIASKMLQLINDHNYLNKLKKRTDVFRESLSELPLSTEIYNGDDLNGFRKAVYGKYDAIIVGSDAIWNWQIRGFPNPYFLPGDYGCPKLSYAASCYGMEFLNLSDEKKSELKNLFDDFDFIGVRDDITSELVRFSGSNTKTVHTCDPTVLLDMDKLPIDKEETEEKLKNAGMDLSKESIAVMGNDSIAELVKKLYGDKYQIVSLYQLNKCTDVDLSGITPYEWAYVFRLCKLTFTTFFHGTLLSLKNGVPVIDFKLNTEFSKNHKTKVEDVLKRFNNEDVLFSGNYAADEFAEKVKTKADELLETGLSEDVKAAILSEADSYEDFKNALLCSLRKV